LFRENVDFFVQFIALLLGDVTYVLDNSLSALADIHKLQLELENESSELTAQERADKEKALVKAERDAISYMSLGNETVAMLKLFTSAIPDAFVKPEIVNTLAGMLNFNLAALVGPKCSNLRVRNPEKYKFNPKALLSEITDVYLNLRTFKPFVKAIALEGRSYRPELFTKLQSLLERHNLKGTPDIALLAKLAANFEETKRKEEEGEVELGEIPDDFLGTFRMPTCAYIHTCTYISVPMGQSHSANCFHRSIDGDINGRSCHPPLFKSHYRSSNH